MGRVRPSQRVLARHLLSLVEGSGFDSLGGDHAIGNADTVLRLGRGLRAHANIYPAAASCLYSRRILPRGGAVVNGIVIRYGRYPAAGSVARFDCRRIRYDVSGDTRRVVRRVVHAFTAQLAGRCRG